MIELFLRFLIKFSPVLWYILNIYIAIPWFSFYDLEFLCFSKNWKTEFIVSAVLASILAVVLLLILILFLLSKYCIRTPPNKIENAWIQQQGLLLLK